MITDGLTPLNLVALLALVGGSGVAGCAIGAAFIAGRRDVARRCAWWLGAGWALYGAAVFSAALTSRDVVLGAGAEKHLCEIDCHLAYSVVRVRTTPTLGNGAARQHARGLFHVVTIQVRFDSATISPHRGMGPLWPGEHLIEVMDGAGGHYGYSLAAQRALGLGDASPLTRPLVPGESYSADVVFDLPAGVRDLRLEIASLVPPTWLVIGHENSFLHKKTTFRLDT